jgi:hypothetical protein
LSTLRSSLYHHNNFTCSLFLNSRFRREIIEAYHIILVGILFFERSSSSTSLGSSRKILYRDAWQTGHSSKFSRSPRYRMQSLEHACIFSIYNPKGQTIFFASYVVVGNSLGFRSIFFFGSSVIFQMPCQIYHSLSSTVTTPVSCLAFSIHLRPTGRVTSCDPLTFGQT